MIIRQKLVPETIANKVTYGKGNKKLKICIHETANTSKGANADAHARLQANGNSRKASWHWQVDDKEAIQSFTHDYRCWHAGTTKGNNESIGIEICVNSDGNYKKAVQNAAQLVAKIIKEENITINDVVQHNHYSGKDCPKIMRKGDIVPWYSFIQMIKSNLATSQNGGKNDVNKPLLTETARNEARELIRKACKQGVFNAAYHTEERIKSYTDSQLISYAIIYLNRTAG